ncbi:uncharacterized protein [Odocoileus virginianus]|uniref:Uncharacterized protein n=1 Tax=Odocoileus virginianus TaxID=9874 RepID=A0ABM4GSN8_ODOVR
MSHHTLDVLQWLRSLLMKTVNAELTKSGGRHGARATPVAALPTPASSEPKTRQKSASPRRSPCPGQGSRGSRGRLGRRAPLTLWTERAAAAPWASPGVLWFQKSHSEPLFLLPSVTKAPLLTAPGCRPLGRPLPARCPGLRQTRPGARRAGRQAQRSARSGRRRWERRRERSGEGQRRSRGSLLNRPSSCLSFLSHTANSRWLSTLHMVIFCTEVIQYDTC